MRWGCVGSFFEYRVGLTFTNCDINGDDNSGVMITDTWFVNGSVLFENLTVRGTAAAALGFERVQASTATIFREPPWQLTLSSDPHSSC